MTELEKLKVEVFHPLAMPNRQRICELLDRAYALGRSERGEKMPIWIEQHSGKYFYWRTAVASERRTEGSVYDELQSNDCDSEEAAIDDARKFWARFGVEIEVKE